MMGPSQEVYGEMDLNEDGAETESVEDSVLMRPSTNWAIGHDKYCKCIWT